MLLSFVFSIGLHPVGARWIQEHYLIAPPQETYSYYGPLNKVAFNVGYHNEHHDFSFVPWNNLNITTPCIITRPGQAFCGVFSQTRKYPCFQERSGIIKVVFRLPREPKKITRRVLGTKTVLSVIFSLRQGINDPRQTLS